jgi:hypothetical protein
MMRLDTSRCMSFLPLSPIAAITARQTVETDARDPHVFISCRAAQHCLSNVLYFAMLYRQQQQVVRCVQCKPSKGKSGSETDVSPLKQLKHPQGVPACCVAYYCADMHLCQTPMMCHRVVSVGLGSMARSARCICIMLEWYMPIRFCRQCCLGHKMASVLFVTCSAGSA